MKKLVIALGATVASSAALIAPSPAAASCSEVIDGTGCIENVVCGAADRVLDKTPLGRNVDCVH